MFAWHGGLDISDKLGIEGAGEEAVESAHGEEELRMSKYIYREVDQLEDRLRKVME